MIDLAIRKENPMFCCQHSQIVIKIQERREDLNAVSGDVMKKTS